MYVVTNAGLITDIRYTRMLHRNNDVCQFHELLIIKMLKLMLKLAADQTEMLRRGADGG